MSDTNTKRLSRLTAILTMLQTKSILTATEIASKFKISVRTVYRDIRALEESGIPIVTEEGKGYSLMEGYKLPPVMFTEKEANALITAGQIIARSKDASLIKEFSQAILKIKAILRYSNKDKAALLSERVFVGKNFDSLITSQNLIEIQMALTNYQLVSILYETPDGKITERLIEPYALYNNREEEWTLAAYCRLRKDFRGFRLDRMKKAEILDRFFKPHTITVEEFLKRNRSDH